MRIFTSKSGFSFVQPKALPASHVDGNPPVLWCLAQLPVMQGRYRSNHYHRHYHRGSGTKATKRWMSTDIGSPKTPSSSSLFLKELFSLEGRSCIVTGAGTGIGPALATGLARAGAAVVLTGRRQSVLEAAVRQIQAQLDVDDENDTKSRRVFASPCDITQFDQIADLVADTEYLTGIPPTILINNAGTNALQKAENLTSEHWHTALELMLTAPFMLTRAMSDHMKVERYGRVINLASLQSFVAFPDSIPYAAAKTGVLGLTRSLAEVYSAIHGYDNVTCNAITPGYVQTDLTQSVFANVDQSERLASATILGRNSVPDDLTGAVVFLSSPAASYVTGQTLVVDGGFTTLGMRW